MNTRDRLLAALLLWYCAATAPPFALSQNHQPFSGLCAIPDTWPHALDSGVAVSQRGMVATDAALATLTGVRILEQNGNAVDAAVATAFALAVVLPGAGNIGGGGFAIVRTTNDSLAALDFRETAPRASFRTMFVDSSGNPTEESVVGHLASGVPGSVAGLWELHHRFGRLAWGDLLEPAIVLAEQGFVVDKSFAASIAEDSVKLFRFPSSRHLFFPQGHVPLVGSLWRNTELAATLRRIARQGADGFYHDSTAGMILDEMKSGKGLIDRQDLEGYHPIWRTPLLCSYRGKRIVAMPPPSSGGVTLSLIANILEGFPLASCGWHSPAGIHLLTEAMRRAFAERNQALGDPDYAHVPLQWLTSKELAEQLRRSIRLDRASPSDTAVAEPHEGFHTTHFSIVDSAGNAVALTTTLNLRHGSGVTVTGGGFLLNDEMDDFATCPGKPNAFGLVQGEANAVAPGRRMLSSMCPVIVLDSTGFPLLVTGASGGPRIITAVFQIISNVLDFGFDLGQAVNAPRVHHQHLPDQIVYEANGLAPHTIAALETKGHHLHPALRCGIGSSIMRRNGFWTGIADPREEGGLARGERER